MSSRRSSLTGSPTLRMAEAGTLTRKSSPRSNGGASSISEKNGVVTSLGCLRCTTFRGAAFTAGNTGTRGVTTAISMVCTFGRMPMSRTIAAAIARYGHRRLEYLLRNAVLSRNSTTAGASRFRSWSANAFNIPNSLQPISAPKWTVPDSTWTAPCRWDNRAPARPPHNWYLADRKEQPLPDKPPAG